MNLPRTKFADENGPWRQFFHLASEVWEVFIALILADLAPIFFKGEIVRKFYNSVSCELVDCQISAHTLRWIFQERYGVDMADCERHVFRKGVERGYYDPQ